MIAGLLFLELWAVNFKAPSKETSGHNSTHNKGTEADRLLKLKELLDSGAITQEEYESKKKTDTQIIIPKPSHEGFSY